MNEVARVLGTNLFRTLHLYVHSIRIISRPASSRFSKINIPISKLIIWPLIKYCSFGFHCVITVWYIDLVFCIPYLDWIETCWFTFELPPLNTSRVMPHFAKIGHTPYRCMYLENRLSWESETSHVYCRWITRWPVWFSSLMDPFNFIIPRLQFVHCGSW